VRAGHPLCLGAITPERYAEACHICVARQGQDREAVDEALAAFGLQRRIVTTVAGFATDCTAVCVGCVSRRQLVCAR
jgi:hypothetical protein